MDLVAKRILGLTSDPEDEELTKEILKILSKRELTVERASRILADAQKMLPFLGKLIT